MDRGKYQQLVAPHDADEIKDLSFSEGEYRRRLHVTQELIRGADLDALVCASLPRICWLTGYETLDAGAPAIQIIPASGDPTLLVSDFEAFNSITSAWVDDVVTFAWADTSVDALVYLLKDRGWAHKRLGWDHDPWSSFLFAQIRDAVEANWSYEANVVEQARPRKSTEEIEAHRAAGDLGTRGFEAAFGEIEEGAIDNDLAAAAYRAIIGNGSESMNLQPIITVGRRSGIPHTTFRRNEIVRGQPVLMEFGACFRRYTSPMIRTAVIGELTDRLWKQMHNACVGAVRSTIELMKPGASAVEIAKDASKGLLALGDDVFVDGNRGYSVGLGFPPRWDDCPGLQIATEQWLPPERSEAYEELQPGHVFHVRAMARQIGHAGVGASETVAVTDDGCEVLTSNDHELVVIE